MKANSSSARAASAVPLIVSLLAVVVLLVVSVVADRATFSFSSSSSTSRRLAAAFLASPPSTTTTTTTTTSTSTSTKTTTKMALPTRATVAEIEDSLAPPAVTSSSTERTKKSSPRMMMGDDADAAADPLDGTRWRVSLSVGRESGTWMPADWGRSGSRINVSFVVEFSSSPSYDRDDLLGRGGGRSGRDDNGAFAAHDDVAKVLRVVDGIAVLGPSISEGERTYAMRDGGWRVSRGEGPLGTDLLRFFVEVDDDRIMHADGDVYVPKGRVYCSCGHFPFATGDEMSSSMSSASSDARESLVVELRNIEERIAGMRKRKDGIRNPFALDGIRISREISRLTREAGLVNYKLNLAAVRDPDRRLLRFTKDGNVGLTREGGVCCQVNKGPIVEYHILGRFGIASVDRD
ncbi:hypothetical protein ACHAW5_002524 [Stephanodiscus triporus]|uniref:Uncharacterized protein n=1 Tax=Stephanodiscus triporus TaxID=2934178 RepID=A0ABD3Q914_9STRA